MLKGIPVIAGFVFFACSIGTSESNPLSSTESISQAENVLDLTDNVTDQSFQNSNSVSTNSVTNQDMVNATNRSDSTTIASETSSLLEIRTKISGTSSQLCDTVSATNRCDFTTIVPEISSHISEIGTEINGTSGNRLHDIISSTNSSDLTTIVSEISSHLENRTETNGTSYRLQNAVSGRNSSDLTTIASEISSHFLKIGAEINGTSDQLHDTVSATNSSDLIAIASETSSHFLENGTEINGISDQLHNTVSATNSSDSTMIVPEITSHFLEIGTEINGTSDVHNDSVCSVCQNCTDDYIDHVIEDVTAHLPPFLELPNRQGRFQLYHGKLIGLNTLKRSEAANVTCRSADDYTVMVPLQIENAKAFYKWQVEMPLRTFYGDLNVSMAHTEARVFYSHHPKTGSLVENLEITALDRVETEFSGAGILNGVFTGVARTLISLFRGYFARTLENTLVHVINKELQDEKKYDKYYETKD